MAKLGATYRFYPINTLRNTAMRGVRSDWLLYLEVRPENNRILEGSVVFCVLPHHIRPGIYVLALAG